MKRYGSRAGVAASLRRAASGYMGGALDEDDFADMDAPRPARKAKSRLVKSPKMTEVFNPDEQPYSRPGIIKTGHMRGLQQMDRRTLRTCELSKAGWQPPMK